MKANHRRFKRLSKGYSRRSGKADLHRALWEEEDRLEDFQAPKIERVISEFAGDDGGRVVLTRGDSRLYRANRFAALRAWQIGRSRQIAIRRPRSGWFARIWQRLLAAARA